VHSHHKLALCRAHIYQCAGCIQTWSHAEVSRHSESISDGVVTKTPLVQLSGTTTWRGCPAHAQPWLGWHAERCSCWHTGSATHLRAHTSQGPRWQAQTVRCQAADGCHPHSAPSRRGYGESARSGGRTCQATGSHTAPSVPHLLRSSSACVSAQSWTLSPGPYDCTLCACQNY
jgi:hypothetical protein